MVNTFVIRIHCPIAAAGGGAAGRCFGLGEKNREVGKWKTCFWFSTFPPAAEAVGMWESCCFRKISKELWKGWESCSWISTLSMAPSFPQLVFMDFDLPASVGLGPDAAAGHCFRPVRQFRRSCSARANEFHPAPP